LHRFSLSGFISGLAFFFCEFIVRSGLIFPEGRLRCDSGKTLLGIRSTDPAIALLGC
jgi:hypothetical protein